MTRLRARLAYAALIAALLSAAIFLRYLDPFFVRALRLIAFDYYQRLAPAHYQPDLPVRVIDIDEESLAREGRWPWPRTKVAKLLQTLTADGAAAIAFDVLFAEPDDTSLEEVAKQLPAEEAQKLSAIFGNRPTNDQVLADALKEAPSVLSVALGGGANKTLPRKAGFASAGDDPRPFLTAFDVSSRNLPQFEEAAKGIGAYNWIADRDQIVRRVPLLYRLGSAIVPSLAAEAVRVAQQASTYVVKSANASGETAFGQSSGINHIRIGNIEIPTDESGEVYLKYRHFNKSNYIPAWKVLTGQISPNEVEGRIILVGTSASGLLDLRATPLDAGIPGVDIHAQLIEHLLTGEFLTRPDYALAVEEFVIVVLGALLATFLPAVSARYAAAIGLFAIMLVIGAGWVAYRYAAVLLDPTYPVLVLATIAAVVTFYTYHRVEAQRGEIRNAFSRYLAPTVVQEIVANPDKLKLGGELRELTLMFCDVRNFTSISERLSATELTHFINELLTPLSEIILERRGTIDKYMGDAIMAFWNAPVDDPGHRSNACAAAISMAKQIGELNKVWQARAAENGNSFQPVRIGIGLNTGVCCVGNLGSTLRFDYSAIGDDVNVTSRFEGLTKIYGLSVAVGERALAAEFPVLELDVVQVKGRKRPEKIYTFLDLLSSDQGQLQNLAALHGKFLASYRQQRWDEAEQLIFECRKLGVSELDACYALFASRIGMLRASSLPAGWDGSFEMTEK